jgi:U2-associated protein SR140
VPFNTTPACASRALIPRAVCSRGQAERDQRREQGLPEEDTPALDNGDGVTTNLFVGNLAPEVDEGTLIHEFGRFGAIGSVKIMWPRDEEQRRRGRNTGFVAFMQRDDAARAKDALDGVTLHDLQMTIGWGKAVALPAVPVWHAPGGAAAGSSGGPLAALAPESTRQRMHDGPPPKEVVRGFGDDIQVAIPSDGRQRFVVDALAFYVLRDGAEFEQAVMARECENPEFRFLYDVRCSEHAYYRWRLFSLASGDSLRSWRVDPFLMVERSARWVPPPMTQVALAQRGAAQRGERRDEASLSDLQRERFEGMLRRLTAEREAIAEAMTFALDNADAAADVAEVLTDSLTLTETPAGTRVARLLLLSDILHNTAAAARNASRYRGRLQDALPDVFESLQEASRCAEGRMAQEALRRHVLKVLRVWRGWYIFSDDFLNGLQATFLRGGTGPAGSRSAASDAGPGAAVNGELALQLAAFGDEELEVKCKHSGLSRRGGREAQVARLLALDTYLNGGSKAQPSQQQRAAPSAEVTERQVVGSAAGWQLVAASGGARCQPSGGAQPVDAAEEAWRRRVRQAELEALQFGEQLEAQGLGAEEVERQTAEHRAGLLAAAEDGSPARRKRERSRDGEEEAPVESGDKRRR